MPVYLIFSCEIIVFSLLIGAFMDSLLLGITILGGVSLVMYAFFQKFYNVLPLIWGGTFLGAIAFLLWASYIDIWLGTTFIAILFSLLSGFLFYTLNTYLFKMYQG